MAKKKKSGKMKSPQGPASELRKRLSITLCDTQAHLVEVFSNYKESAWAERAYRIPHPMGKRYLDGVLHRALKIADENKNSNDAVKTLLCEGWALAQVLALPIEYMFDKYVLIRAAAIWVTQHISDRDALQSILPSLEYVSREMIDFTIVPDWSQEEVAGIERLMEMRNALNEDEEPTVPDSYSAQKKKNKKGPWRSAYDQLIQLIPKEDIEQAVANFVEIYHKREDWVIEKIENACTTMEKFRTPLVAHPNSFAQVSPSGFRWNNAEQMDDLEDGAYDHIADEISYMYIRRFEDYENEVEVQEYLQADPALQLIKNPYEICFSVLFLADIGSELIWQSADANMMLLHAATMLPWWPMRVKGKALEALFDSVLDPDFEIDEPDIQDDWYVRDYKPRGYPFKLSLAQILFVTSCGSVAIGDTAGMQKFATVAKRLGIKNKQAGMILSYIASSSNLQFLQNHQAAEDDEDEDSLLPETVEEGTEPTIEDQAHEEQTQRLAQAEAELDAARKEIKQLKAALHSAETESKRAQQELNSANAQAEKDRLEMAALREQLFSRTAEQTDSLDDTQENGDPDKFPYEVQNSTVIFGGHDTWAKAIKPLLKGNVRFVEKELYTFDPALIRSASVVWLQTNSMTHSFYHRIVENAKTNNKALCFFTNASARKGAEQVAEFDQAFSA